MVFQLSMLNEPNESVSARIDHGGGGTVPPRRSKTLPRWPFPAAGKAKGFIPWTSVAMHVLPAGRGEQARGSETL